MHCQMVSNGLKSIRSNLQGLRWPVFNYQKSSALTGLSKPVTRVGYGPAHDPPPY